jgi:hypothetical protein
LIWVIGKMVSPVTPPLKVVCQNYDELILWD